MDQPELRSEPRIPVSFPGTLRAGAENAVPCRIQNMCSRGFLIRAAQELPVGRLVHLTCELYPDARVECTVQVRHVNRDCLGAKVTEMSEEHQMLCRKFLAEQGPALLARAAPPRLHLAHFAQVGRRPTQCLDFVSIRSRSRHQSTSYVRARCGSHLNKILSAIRTLACDVIGALASFAMLFHERQKHLASIVDGGAPRVAALLASWLAIMTGAAS